MHFSKKVLGLAVAVLSLASVLGCSDPKKQFHPVPPPSTGGTSGVGGNGGAGGGTANCGPGSCTGHSHCSSGATCECDTGYLGGNARVGEPLTCTVDKNCIKLKPLVPDSCRFFADGAPAVASFFAVDYCSGTAVLPQDLGAADKAFRVTEDDVDMTDNVEASVSVIGQKSLESYVTFALDVSTSVSRNKELLTELVGQIKAVVQAITPKTDTDTPVGVSIQVFGRFVAPLLPFTMDMGLVNQTLDDLAADPSAAIQQVGGDGTALYEVVGKGIHGTERIEALRDAATEGGVLTTGTLVVITDGQDQSGATLDADQIKNTTVSVISVGVSGDISDKTLTDIGRDGSFLAPDTAARKAAFSEIATRVSQYPQRSYLLGYCTPKTQGIHTIAVTLANGKATQAATCSFDTKYFASAPLTCNKAYFNTDECNNLDCGGITACGGCLDTECCAHGICQAPTAANFDCAGQDELCAPAGQLCEPVPGAPAPAPFQCTAPVPLDGLCGPNARCQPGVATCTKKDTNGQFHCEAIAPGGVSGDVCGDKTKGPDELQCQSLACGVNRALSTDPQFPFTCIDQPQVYQDCKVDGTVAAICEPGSVCDDKSHQCVARRVRGCDKNEDCVGGVCSNNVCYSAGCYWDWNSKLAH